MGERGVEREKKRESDAAMDNSERVKRGKGREERRDWKWQLLKQRERWLSTGYKAKETEEKALENSQEKEDGNVKDCHTPVEKR